MRGFISVTKAAAVLIIGPVGCYVAYNALFVLRYLPSGDYPSLAAMYGPAGTSVEAGLALVAIVVSALLAWRLKPFDVDGDDQGVGLTPPILTLICVGVAGLMWLSVFRIMGGAMWTNFSGLYMHYQEQATNGAAWMILACYAAIYLLLFDMFSARVRLGNSAAFFFCIAVVAISGGRGLLMIFILVYFALMVTQRMRPRQYVIYSAVALLAIFATFVVPSSLRMTGTVSLDPSIVLGAGDDAEDSLAPTETWEGLNYNAAFIVNDVLAGLDSETLTPGPYALHDAAVLFIPRAIFPDKPISSAETLALYPHVAERGSNITVPLKANLMMHLGAWAFYLDWGIVLIAQLLFMLGLKGRSIRPTLVTFMLVFWGLAFLLIARGGLLNARLIPQVVLIITAFAGYHFLLALQRRIPRREEIANA
jgi:hypothetical protein